MNNKSEAVLHNIFTSPNKYLWQINGGEAWFVDMDRDAYHNSIFSDARIAPISQTITKISLQELWRYHDNLQLPEPSLSYIFHIAHCGSTLLARGLDLRDKNIVYREPFALRQLGVSAAENPDTSLPEWHKMLHLTATLLSKKYFAPGPSIIKANVPVNFIIPKLMDLNRKSKGILLYLTLDDYLLAILRTQNHRNWVSRVTKELANGISKVIGVNSQEIIDMPIHNAAACLWATQMFKFQEAAKKYGGLRHLDAEYFFSHPEITLKKSFEFFEMQETDEAVKEITSGELFKKYSKQPTVQYNNEMRINQKNDARNRIHEDLANAINYGVALSENIGLSKSISESLTDSEFISDLY